MASTSSSTPSTPVTLSSTLSLPKSCTSHTANKIENLVEYSYIPESAQISESSYPLISPYHLYKRPSSFTRSIRTLISTRRPHPKEYIQSSRLDQCSLQATPAEQYVTLEIPSELISNWKREGYTHLHLGGIRLILTLHGRKGLPVTARLAMLDTRFKQYQDAVIGTVLTTLHAGSVLLTFYPNFNLSLQDPNLPTTLKVQIQIQGAEQISSAKIATLHHQLVYRLQNHALDLPTPEHHSDTLMVLAESDQIPTIIQIPRQIPRHELIKLMPLEWISNYEQFHNNTAPIQTSESMFERRQDGTVRMTFKPPPSAPQEPPRLSFTYSSMITAVQTAQEDLPITGFNSEGYPVYPAKHNGHFLWDAPGSGMCDPNCPCWDDWEEDDDHATTRKKKPKKKKPPVPCHHCDPKPPSDPPPPPAPLPIYRKELKWIAKHCKSEIPSPLPNPTPIVQPLACMMFSSTSSDYSSSFPSLEPHTDPQRNVVSKPFIPSPITSTGHLEPPKPFESVLNWQTQNARAQNDTLLHLNSRVENISLRTEQIETKVDSITAQMQQIYQNLQSRISQLDSELRAMLAHRYSGPEFDQKEREIRRLKAELAQIESERQRPTLFTTSPPIPSISPTYHPFASMLSPIKQYDPSKLFGMTHTLFRDNPLPPPPKPKPKPRPQPRPAPLHPSSLTIPGQPSPSSTPTSPPAPLFVPTQSKDKEPMHQFTAHTVTHSSTTVDQTSDSNPAVSDSPTETDTESSVSTSDSEKSYADITKILMAQPDQPTQGQTSHTEPYVDIPSEVEEEMPESSATNQPPPTQTNPSSQKSSNGPWFTFDDLPSHKWRDRLNEMSAWIDLQMLRPGATTQSVLREFATRFTGALRDWFDSLGQYRQLQFVDLPEVSSALAVLHDQFLGDPSAVFEAARRDYLNMKCCSLNAKDLDFHYKRMSLLFYKLNGFNEPTLKHVFLASLPEELQPNIQRQLTASNLSLDNISLGKIFQLAKTCLDKLCEQKQFFKELLKDKEPFRSACKKPYLQIKCHKKKDCDCSSKKKRHFRKFKPPEFSSKPRRSRKPYRFFRKKSSSSREFKRKQSSRCFICKRKGHYAKDCPNKREKSIRLVEHLQATTDYSPAKDELEFYFSEQDEPNDETVFALQNSSDSDSDQSQVIFHQQSLSLDTTVPIPSIKLQILPSKFQRPIPAIGLIDTGAQRSMLNPHILPSEYWTQSEEHFKAVNGKLFTTSLITKKPIGIQIFPNCVIWTKVIGSTLPNKDILLGFDVLHQIKHLQIIPTGIRVKSMFKPFTDILKLYNLSETPQSYQDISTKLLSFCPESHSEFTHPNPLWKNKSFFIKLPFKLNEDINPTKATHPGMSPSDLLLAQQECSQLLAQGLIEPTSSQWACQAFYVEKHSEIVRGKKRLVIDYQPLNMFLQDDKFPLPRRQSMFTFLKNAQIFSKFDLKSGFWQLGIEPSERYKTAFCIPNAHFQWTVLPFGLKTAPSIFQKSMVQIFQPILHHALIYIDDILLFSGSHNEHRQLLSQFYDILQSHGIMLSAKKSIIATDNVEFLGMIIKDGHYQPGKHIAQELLHFPDQQLSKRQIQQFLGIINYIRDFIPHVDHYTHHLSALLKKKPPEWNADHTFAVTTLKQIAQNPPPLKLITDGKRILQTDASDESWGAILLEEINGKENFIAYASGHFSDTQKHYHSVFKEILAVKNGIKKFEYHLIGHHFLIRMDSSAFPNIFHFKDFRRRENFSFMASTSSSTPSTPVTLSSTLSLPKSCTSHTANKIENLIEYSYIPESAQISESSYPLISPYQLYKRPSSFTRSIRTLISTRRPHPKEYIQSSRLDQCSLQATLAEQYVTLEIPSELISNWKREGYTHLHLGGIRLILTLHGRKGLPVTARLAMLDTRFKQYQDAVIGTVLTTLHAGSVLLTFYPNFNLSLQDPNLPTTLKVQIQIQGAEQISSAKIATLHHQLVYRLQNHALDLPTPEHHSDTLMVLAESDQIPTIIQIPRQIPRHELIKLMPLEWISNYEQFHNNTAPIQTSESMFERRQDGTVRMTFKPPPSAPQEPPQLSFTCSSMITAVQTAQEDLPITGFNSEGYPVYPAKHNGHFLWDAPGSGMCDPNCPCWDDWEEDDDYATTRKKKPKKKKPPVPCHHCDPKPPSDPPPPPAPLPIYRKELKWIAKHCKSEIPSPLPNSTPIVQPLACMMFSSTSSEYSSSFPSLEPHTDPQRNVVSKPFIPSPITSTGHLEPPKPFESVLNWQTQNARAQNDTLLHLNSRVENISLRTEQIETKVDSITAQMQQIYQNLQSRISQLDSELRAMLAHRYSGPEFDQKEREIRRLKAELAQIESERQRPTLFTTSPPIPSISPTYHPFASMLSPIKQYDPSKLFGMTHTLFRDNPLPPPPKPKPKPRPQPRPAPLHPSSLTIPGQPSPSSTPTLPPAPLFVPTQSKDKEPMHQFTAHTVTHSSTTVDHTSDSNPAVSDSPTETDTESSVSTSDSEKSYADITKILMAQPDQPTQGQTSHTEPYVDIPSEVEEEMPESSATNQPPPTQTNPSSQKSSNGPWFTFDDLPSHKWRDRLNEMSAWIDLQMLRPGATTQSVLREFATRFTGALRDWFDSLGQYRQLQFVDLPEVSGALAVLHDQFLGDPSAVFEAARRDYLNMKCCSLNAKDLDFHYKRMSLLFYKLNGFNEPTLKHVFLASLPEELQPNIQRQLTASNLSLDNISLGKIFQLAKTCLDKLCEQKQFFKELLKDKEPFRSACKKPYLQIKCHKKKDCDCSSKKKRHFQKFKPPEFSSKPRRSRKPYRFFRKKSSSSREFKRKQSSRCFICKRKGHYAKDCPNKREKSIRLVEHLQATTDYSPAKDELEFYFSEQDEPNDETVFALQNSSDSDSDQSQVIFHQQSLSLDTTVPIPSIKLQILPSKFQRPIPAIGLIDTGAQRSMLNPHILPSEYWTQSEEHFKAVNGKLFTTSLITKKPIGIQIFPNCVIWTKVIGSTLPNKDILLGFDILHQIKHLQIIPTGIRVKSMFKPFTDILKLYNLSETPQSYQDISTKLLSFCPESHSEFTHPNPLWKNKSFFIKLPFKLNEDINPTKATHPGMSPSDLLLAQQECSQLLAQGLIEPTSSQWACQAFYVEKHSEIVRGKKRLVIDYQPLNMFLQDDKFPLPRRQSMFTFLKNAQIFSKFDLKSGFWQLGIEPSERYKTAFCIPNAHFQWTVLPFGLKTAPSIFQKSMVQIFQPILHHALIYIDDILLFSGSHNEHRQLLSQFYDILQSHGIMLSAKKSIIATDNVEFLGMIIKDGHYQPGKHIAQELLHFPDQQLSKRQIQQFLGIINYIRDFIPHVDHYTHHLSALLKKKPPEWNADHTFAVTTLKQIAQNPPPLKLITDGKRILQTDASDESWGAILLEEINGKENFIAYASGHFSDTQKHYHSVFKEILAVKNGIKKFEYHLIGHHFLIRMDSSAFPNIFHFKGKTVPEKMLLRLKDWFSKYDFSVKHIKGSQNLIPDMLSRLSKPENPLILFSTTYHFPIISMATSLPPQALTKKTFPFNKTFSSVFAIQEFARKALFRFFMKAYLVTDPFPFSTFHPENLFLTGLTLDPTRETTEDVLWYIWCLTVLYATKLVLPITPTLEHLLDPDKATSLTWTLLEWFSPIPWWRRKLQQLSEIYNLDRMPAPEAPLFTSVFIIHRPYFQHPDTKLFWTQDQVYEWFTAPHIAVIENDIQDVLHNYLCQLNHQPPPLKDISHTSLGPQHDLLMIPTPSAISKPKSTGIIIKEEKPDYTDFLFQDSQDPWDAFLPLSQHLHQFPQPTMDEPGPSEPGPSTQSSKRPAQPSKVDKATQTSPKYTPKCTPRDYNCPYPPCRGPSCKHPKLSKIFFPKGNPDNPDETESSSEDEYMNLRSP
ncbi:hypothetical protein KPL71_017497 [Citrus sinensis]|uniref:Uncharacterized protein n=1 Tax=Citrus sinensis TaxID=2711 RepID=A0ACB8JQ73_CITSI|nr:hypothetical protein KPL71_017497 [Citrus sinensis]